ncbi:FAD-dependent oxidoreductase [Streptomyces yangpuensis]|uniref:FAD-dependent oxidoreductase n=1 Tax=Streptomyces yangpuensis TaxID=1648182 RepID=UPI0036501867
MTHAVVLGGGLTGMLTAAALKGRADRVTVLESDVLPDSPQPRRGLPQGHHNHMLMGGGAEAFDKLIPGTTELLYAAGAQRRGLPGDALALSPEGWFHRHPSEAYVLLCSRDLLDHVVRRQVLGDGTVELVGSAKVTGLTGDATKVTGVTYDGEDGPRTLEADFVVDATGRRSKSPQWLVDLGLPLVHEEYIDGGFAYASRVYQAPPGTPEDFPGVLLQAKTGTDQPGRGAALLPNENGRWIVTLFGTRGGEPPTDEEGFVRYARERDHPIIADLIDQAEPLSEIRAYRGMANRRLYFEKLPMPRNFVVLGDAFQALNPNHGTGMSVAAQSALVLRDLIDAHPFTPDLSRTVQAAIAKVSAGPWQLVLGTDQFFPGVKSNLKRPGNPSQLKMTARLARIATENAYVSNTLFRIGSLSARPSSMLSPAFIWAALRGPRRRLLTAEEAIAQFPEFGDLLTRGKALNKKN